ncbi:MAG: hypothetical protein ACRDSP_22135 [Pseudonocardiaceae bacterium]
MSRWAADRLANFSGHRLAVFECPGHPDGWHVCAPDIELAPRTRAIG